MPQHEKHLQAKGLVMALSAAIFWGISGTCAQFLFEQKNIDPAWLVSWRLLLAGLILVIFSIFNPNTKSFEIWKNKSDVIQLMLFSLLGMVAVQFTYFYSIQLSNAATATVLQYIGPLFVVTYYAFKNRRWPRLIEYFSLILALSGTFLLVTHGSFHQLIISENALFWGILSAIALAFYTIQPAQLLRKYSPKVVTGWGMLIGGIVFSLYTTPFYVSGTWDIETWGAFGTIIIFGSLIAFYFFLTSVTIVGPKTASLLCSVEPLSGALVAVLWLNVAFGLMDWIGTAFILITIGLLTRVPKTKNIARLK